MYDPQVETFDALGTTGLHVIQPKKGYRFSIDPFLLAAFTPMADGDRCLDLGTGSGVLPLLLSSRWRELQWVGVELQPEVVRRAQRTMDANVAAHIQIVQADVRRLPESLQKGSFDRVVSNPPFRRAGQGRVPPDAERAAARFELAGGLEAFTAAAAAALRPGGTFSLIHLAERCVDVVTGLRQAGLEPKRLRLVQPYHGQAAQMVLVSACKGAKPGMDCLPPLTIYRSAAPGERAYTDEVLAIYGMSPA